MSDLNVLPSHTGVKLPWYRKPRAIRHTVMAFFFLFLAHVAWDHQVKGGGPRGTPSVEAYCPFGGLESLYQFLTTGGFVRRIEPSAMIIFGALVVLAILGSRGFCGWICPFGSLQEWLGILGRKLFRTRFNPTGAWDRRLTYLKYIILVVIIALTWHLGTLVFRDYDPFLAFFHLGFGISELPWAYVILGVVLAGSLYIERFFCKYACPLGAVLAVLGKLGISKIHRDPEDCKGCNVCQQRCFAHIDFLNTTTIRDPECNHCMECVASCPKPNVLRVSGWSRRISPAAYGALLVVGLFALIGASKLAGMWQTKPAAVSFTNRQGKLDPENIRGWMTLEEISKGYSVPLDRLYELSGLPRNVPPTARLNAIAREYKLAFEPDKLRDIVQAALDGSSGPVRAPLAPSPSQDHSGDGGEVRGYMTLNEVALKTGVSASKLRQALNLPDLIDSRQPLREYMHDYGMSIQDVRNAVKALAAEKR